MTSVYLIQIALLVLYIPMLLFCLIMVYRSRYALNGLARSLIVTLVTLIALFVLLGIRRLDDAFGIFNEYTTVIFSSAVVLLAGIMTMLLTIDLYYLYRIRDVIRVTRLQAKIKEARLEAMRERNEQLIGKSWDIR